ncbi:hypothetical protein VPHD260_0201 [Vibrio phage D260]
MMKCDLGHTYFLVQSVRFAIIKGWTGKPL